MKKIISMIVVAALLCSTLTIRANAAQEPNERPFTVIYENPMTEEEFEEKFWQHILEQVEGLGLNPAECAVSLGAGDIIPLNDPDDYKTEYSGWKTVSAKGYPGNQPFGGMMFPTGGGFYISDDGGPVISVALNFPGLPAPFQKYSISVSLGNVSNSGGLYANAPRTDTYYRCVVEREYRVNAYVIYHRSWSEPDWAYVWNEWSGGVYKEYVRGKAWAEAVS